MKPHLEERNKLIRERYWELLPQTGTAEKTYEALWDEFKLKSSSLHQIIHHIHVYDKALGSNPQVLK